MPLDIQLLLFERLFWFFYTYGKKNLFLLIISFILGSRNRGKHDVLIFHIYNLTIYIMTLTKRNNSSLGHLLLTVHLKHKFNDVPADDMWQYWLIIRTHDQFNWLLTYSLYVCWYPNVIQLHTSPMYFQLKRHFNTLYMTVCRSR